MASILRAPLPPDVVGFNMLYYVAEVEQSDLDGGTEDPEDTEKMTATAFREDAPACGTICCAMGLAGLDPKFQAEGLVWDKVRGKFVVGGEEHLFGEAAAGKFFDIPWEDADTLFGPACALYLDYDADETQTPVDPLDVAAVIEHYANTGRLVHITQIHAGVAA
jgi:hypothetical protein